MRRIWIRAARLAAFLFCLAAAPALADTPWLKASTTHFNVYGSMDAAALSRTAVDLERYHRLLVQVLQVDEKPSSQLDVYLFDSRADLQRVEPGLDSHVAGFYRAGPGGRAAFVAWDDRDRDQAREILQHEYAHHIMRQYFSRPYPPWFVEGFAEYFATAELKAQTIELGRAPEGRAQALRSQSWMSLDGLLSANPRAGQDKQVRIGMVYAQGWLLTHYLLADSARAAQLQAYFAALGRHEPEPAAFAAAFNSDHAALQRQLTSYAKNDLTYAVIPSPAATAPAVTVTALPASADALLLTSLRLIRGRRGESDQAAADLTASVAKAAARFPDDVLAQRTLAHAQQAFGDPAAAVGVLRTPGRFDTDPYAQYLLGVSWLTMARKDPTRRAEAAPEAKRAFARALKLDPAFYPALNRYAGLLEPGSEAALDALVEAHMLAPQVDEIRINAVILLLKRGEYDLATSLVAPLAAAPHLDLNVAVAQVLLDSAQARTAPPAEPVMVAEARRRLAATPAD